MLCEFYLNKAVFKIQQNQDIPRAMKTEKSNHG